MGALSESLPCGSETPGFQNSHLDPGEEQEEASPAGRPPLVSHQTDNQIYYHANFMIRSHRVDVFSPDPMAVPYTYSPCEYRIFMLLSYDALSW